MNSHIWKRAKSEVLNDIAWNPDMRFIVEQIAGPSFEKRQLELLTEFKQLLHKTLWINTNSKHSMFEDEIKSGSRNMLRFYASIIEWENETDKQVYYLEQHYFDN